MILAFVLAVGFVAIILVELILWLRRRRWLANGDSQTAKNLYQNSEDWRPPGAPPPIG